MTAAWLLEIRRRPRRFGPLTIALAALAFLSLAVAALADGLLLASTGSLRSTDADLYVYADVARGSATASVLPLELTTPTIHVPGVAGAGPVTYVPTTADVGGPDDTGVVVVGFSQAFPGQPAKLRAGRLPRDGEPGVAAVDARLLEGSTAVGGTVSVAGRSLEIVGVVEDAGYLLQPTVWVPPYEAVRVRAATWPEMGVEEGLASLIAVQLLDGADAQTVAADIDATLEETATLTATEAYRAIPGVGAQQSTLRAVVVVTATGAALIAALFVSLLALDRRRLLRTLVALGAERRDIVGGALLQAAACAAVGIAGAAAGLVLLRVGLPDTVPFALRPTTVAVVAVGVLVATAAGGGFASGALRRAAAR